MQIIFNRTVDLEILDPNNSERFSKQFEKDETLEVIRVRFIIEEKGEYYYEILYSYTNDGYGTVYHIENINSDCFRIYEYN